uniref:Uncharacterized protein n=1 Tax=Anguilla anguilla TaxID=7936 RepID=A0A0E9TDR4_ANGAN
MGTQNWTYLLWRVICTSCTTQWYPWTGSGWRRSSRN